MSMAKKSRNSCVALESACSPACESAYRAVSSAKAWPWVERLAEMRQECGTVLRCLRRPLMNALNRRHEKGQPCLHPRPMGVSGVSPCLVSTTNEQSLSMSAMRVTISAGTPSELRDRVSAHGSIESYALRMSM